MRPIFAYFLSCFLALPAVAFGQDIFATPERPATFLDDFVTALTPDHTSKPTLSLNEDPEICAGFLAAWRRAYLTPDALMSLDPVLGGWDIDVVSARFDEDESDEFEVFPRKTLGSNARVLLWRVDLDGDGTEEGLIFDRFSHSWRGDWHPVWVVAGDALDDALNQAASGSPQFYDVENAVLLVQQDWTPPIILQGADDAVYLHRRFSYSFHANETLFRVTPTALEPVCRVDFLSDPLPAALNELTESIQHSQGEELCGGTLRSLDRLKGRGRVAAENLIARPWALDPPYDSRETIREALELWSFVDPWSRRVYLKLLSQVGPVVAETEVRLAASHPDLTLSEREWLAEEAVWRFFGANYIFGGSGVYNLNASDHIALLYRGEMTPAEADEMNQEADPTDYALLFAVLDHPALLKAMLATVDVDADDGTGKTALMYAAQLDDLSLLNTLLEAGADVDAVTKDVRYTRLCSPRRAGLTALHYAAKFGGRSVIERLLEAGSKPDLVVDDASDIIELLGINEVLAEADRTVLRLRVASDR